MRVTFLANKDLASNVALNLVLPQLAKKHDLSVFLSEAVGHPPYESALSTLTFFEQTLINVLVFPSLDANNKSTRNQTFNGLNKYLSQPSEVLNDPNSRSGLSKLKATKPHLLISIRYGRILHQEAIDVASLGVLNLHSGKLPDYRGVMATFRAMMAEDDTLFSTLHWIDDKTIDTGRILSMQDVPRDPHACYLSNVLSLYPSGCRALIAAVETLAEGRWPEAQDSNAAGNYYSFPTQAELATFHSNGHKLVDIASIRQILRRYYGR